MGKGPTVIDPHANLKENGILYETILRKKGFEGTTWRNKQLLRVSCIDLSILRSISVK
jgi:hypothetical protein